LFDPTRVDAPHLEISPLGREKVGGFGLYLLNTLVDRVAYRLTEKGWNELVLLKNRG
jgi:anti-sigma regulatory factor (Ser/Thr protein kinase)